MANTNKRILLADDDAAIRNMYRERILAEGHEVIEVQDGEAAIEAAKKEKPDLILLDIMMPKVNGLDVLAIVKREPETRDIPVIILTALASEVDKVREISQGFCDYVVKADTTPGEIIAKVNATLGVIK